jgi:hypothetical protein
MTMQKYRYESGFSQDGGMEPYAGDGTEFYLVTDVDAKLIEWRKRSLDAEQSIVDLSSRITQLEAALRAIADDARDRSHGIWMIASEALGARGVMKDASDCTMPGSWACGRCGTLNSAFARTCKCTQEALGGEQP